MSHSASRSCPDCGGTMTANGGFDQHSSHGAVHGLLHGVRHADPLSLALGAGIALGRTLFPKKLVCDRCGHTIRG